MRYRISRKAISTWLRPARLFSSIDLDANLLIFRTGALRKVTRRVPLRRINNVRYTAGPLARALGYGTVTVDLWGGRDEVMGMANVEHADELADRLVRHPQVAGWEESASAHFLPGQKRMRNLTA